MRRRHTGSVLAAASLILTGCTGAHQTSPTAGLARTGDAAYPGNAYGPALVAGDALAFEIMLANGYDTPALKSPAFTAYHAAALAD